MQFSIATLLATTMALGLSSAAALETRQSSLTIYLYSDNNCEHEVPGSGYTNVNSDTCDTGPFQTGWSSAKIVNGPSSKEGTVTFYTKNNCGDPAAGSHGYSDNDKGCLNHFGFTANAVGYDTTF